MGGFRDLGLTWRFACLLPSSTFEKILPPGCARETMRGDTARKTLSSYEKRVLFGIIDVMSGGWVTKIDSQ